MHFPERKNGKEKNVIHITFTSPKQNYYDVFNVYVCVFVCIWVFEVLLYVLFCTLILLSLQVMIFSSCWLFTLIMMVVV